MTVTTDFVGSPLAHAASSMISQTYDLYPCHPSLPSTGSHISSTSALLLSSERRSRSRESERTDGGGIAVDQDAQATEPGARGIF